MKIEEIQKGKKYFKARTKTQSRKKITVITGIPVFVLEVDLVKQEVFASFNGGPGQWFKPKAFCRWKKTDPSTVKNNL